MDIENTLIKNMENPMNKKSIISHSIVALVVALFMWFFASSRTEVVDLKTKLKNNITKNEQLTAKVNTLETTNKKLSQQITESYREERKPDGSVIIVRDTTTNIDVFESKIKDVKADYERQIALKDKTISELSEYKKTEINKKSYLMGYSKNFLGNYNHNIFAQASVFGRLGVIVNTSFGKDYSVGAGITLAF